MLIDAGERGEAQARRLLPRIFVAALAIRWAYAIAIYLFMGDRGLMSEDSVTYMYAAGEFLTAISAGKVHGLDWFGLDPWFMPLFYWLITLHLMVFGKLAALSYVLMQGVLDAATCVVIYYIALAVHPRYARGAAICAVINPTQIVLSGIFFTDTPFLFFTSLMLLGALRWLNRPSGRAAALLAAGLCGAFLIRVVMAPWAAMLIPALLVAGRMRGVLSAKQAVRMCLAAAVVAAFVGGIAARNAAQFGSLALTPQGGHHLALWVLPLVKEAQDRTPWAETNGQVKLQRQKMFGDVPRDHFELERQYRAVAGPELDKLSPASFAKAWATGIALSLASPGILISPPVYYLPRTGFFATAGASLFEKCVNFLFYSGSSIHAFATVLGLIGLALVRMLQLIGIVAILRRRENLWPAALLAGWVGYILLINGPIASPKYRLPIEPVLMVACSAGLLALRRKPSAA